ncbi:MAG TPA: pseudouridine synthase, partial [Cytophagaceae bacterium]|nr:pseudouridine synthase [Cytophagaceae bacterium]
MKINEFLVKSMSISHKEAVSLIRNTKIFVNTKPAAQKQLISFQDQIVFEEKILQNAGAFFYYAYYKPYGIECTMNENIPDNLPQAVAIPKPFFPIGRLDKNSEGLLILTNDGNTYEKVANASKFKEKEYIVTVDKELSEEVIQKLATGITIMGKKTRPAEVKKITDSVFTIILTQGLNRQ